MAVVSSADMLKIFRAMCRGELSRFATQKFGGCFAKSIDHDSRVTGQSKFGQAPRRTRNGHEETRVLAKIETSSSVWICVYSWFRNSTYPPPFRGSHGLNLRPRLLTLSHFAQTIWSVSCGITYPPCRAGFVSISQPRQSAGNPLSGRALSETQRLSRVLSV